MKRQVRLGFIALTKIAAINCLTFGEYYSKASATRLESVRLLVESGADVNHVTAIGYSSALDNAFLHENLDILEYLIFDKKANYNIVFNVTIQGDTLRIANMLRRLVYPLDSKEYLGKMELVHYLEARGID